MVLNQASLITAVPIKNMENKKIIHNGMSYGLGEAGYDIRIKQNVRFSPTIDGGMQAVVDGFIEGSRFVLASAIEEFQMPDYAMGIVHDKSSWARQGLSVFNTVIEPGWNGFLTLELVYHGHEELFIPSGTGIAQVVFHALSDPASYNGKYQNQGKNPVEAIFQES